MLKDSRKRQEDILAIIVTRYVETAEPVGSRYVSRRLNLSSATIRNVMADLEEMGLITHPHTSAGRIPTDKGYRYYIDSLMLVKSVNEQMARVVKEQYDQAIRSLEDVMEKTCHLISGLTNYVGLTMFSQYDKLYLDGASHIIEQPEFKDLKKLYIILKCLEEKRDILDILSDELNDERLMIHIGRENRSNRLSDCSIVSRGYRMKGKVTGRVGVIGPKRMAYEKVIPTVEFLADTVTNLLDELED
jgi:transcriptional regulator of heat shock response